MPAINHALSSPREDSNTGNDPRSNTPLARDGRLSASPHPCMLITSFILYYCRNKLLHRRMSLLLKMFNETWRFHLWENSSEEGISGLRSWNKIGRLSVETQLFVWLGLVTQSGFKARCDLISNSTILANIE